MNTTVLEQKEQQLLWEIEQQHRISACITHARNETEQIFNSAGPLCVIQHDCTIIRVNNTFCNLFAFRKDDIIGKPCNSIWNSSICGTTSCPLKIVMSTGRPFTTEGTKRTAGHDEKDCLISASPFYNENGIITGIVENFVDITIRKKMENDLAEKRILLEKQNVLLTEKNAALSELMRQVKKEKTDTQEHVAMNIHHLILPLIEQLRKSGLDNPSSSDYLHCLARNLNELTSSFGTKLAHQYAPLSQKEIAICNMVKNGLCTKDIARMLHLSDKTIETHRKNIRKKLGITNQQQNLQSTLQAMMST